MTMINNGGLDLPSGSQAFIPSNNSIKFEPIKFTLPEIPSQSSFTVPVTYYGRIFDQPPPNKPGPFVSKAEFIPRVELLGRPFERSFYKQTLVVQYPIKLEFMRCPENLGRGEVATVEIGIRNISRMPYGNCNGSGGNVMLQLHFDQRILPLAAANIGMSMVPYTVTYDPNIRDSMYIQMHEIPPEDLVVVQVTIQMESRAELFDRCFWQTDVYLREKLIEYNFEKIRVSPFYTHTKSPSDILMITSSAISRKEFVFWQRIFECLNISVDFWDYNRYNGVSVDNTTNTRHQASWEGRYGGRTILYPHADLQSLWGIDIIRHFHGPNFREGTSYDLDSGMVLFLPQGPPKVPRTNPYFYDYGDNGVFQHLCLVNAPVELPENTYGGTHFVSPGSLFTTPVPFRNKEKDIIKKFQKDEPQRTYAILGRQINIESAGFMKYKYGLIDIRQCPLLRSCKFLCVDSCGSSKVAMSHDDKFLNPSSCCFPLGSNFGQTFLAVMFSIPLRCKMTLLVLQDQDINTTSSTDILFTFPNGGSINKAELAMVCIAKEVADEVLNCSGECNRMDYIVEQVSSNPEQFVTNGEAIVRGMELIKKEVKLCKKSLSNRHLSRACDRIEKSCKAVVSLLARVGVNHRHLPLLPHYVQLMDCDSFHFTHQNTVADDHYNLTGQ
jgi:hypothetical protein